MRIECVARVVARDRMNRGLPDQEIRLSFAMVAPLPIEPAVSDYRKAARIAAHRMGWTALNVVEVFSDA